jgi:hypothetical protein
VRTKSSSDPCECHTGEDHSDFTVSCQESATVKYSTLVKFSNELFAAYRSPKRVNHETGKQFILVRDIREYRRQNINVQAELFPLMELFAKLDLRLYFQVVLP